MFDNSLVAVVPVFFVAIVVLILILFRNSKRKKKSVDGFDWFTPPGAADYATEKGTRFFGSVGINSSDRFISGVFADPSLGNDTRVADGVAFNVVKGYPVFVFRYGWFTYEEAVAGDGERRGDYVPHQTVLSAVSTGGNVPVFCFRLVNPGGGDFNAAYSACGSVDPRITRFLTPELVQQLMRLKPLRVWSEQGGWVFFEWTPPKVNDSEEWEIVLDDLLFRTVSVATLAPSVFLGKPLVGHSRELGLKTAGQDLFPKFLV